MDDNNFLFEAKPQRSKNPIKTSELDDFFNRLNVGDNLYIKRTNGDNINIRIIKKNSDFDYVVNKGKDTFSILCQIDPRNKNNFTFIVGEFNNQTKKTDYFRYNDIVYITLSDKKELSKIIYDPSLNTDDGSQSTTNKKDDEPETIANTSNTSNNSDLSNKIDQSLERLKTKLEPLALTVLNTYYNKKDDLKTTIKNLNNKLDAFIDKELNKNGKNKSDNNEVKFVSLSKNMIYEDGIWVTTNSISKQFKPQPQRFSGNPRELKQSLIDVLTVIKPKDFLSLVISSTERYAIMVDVTPSKTVSFKAISPDRLISVSQNKSYAGKQYRLTQLSTDYTQPDVVRIGDKNKLVLPLFIDGTINSTKQVYEFTGISAFTYTPSVYSIMEETLMVINNNLSDSISQLSDESKIVINYNDFDDEGNANQQKMSMVLEEKDGLFTIVGSTLSELNGKTISKNSIFPSYYQKDKNLVSGSVIQTIEGMALGNLVSVEIFQKNESGEFEDNARELSDVEFTDKELYDMVIQDPTLKNFMLKTPSFWGWLKHKKNDFNGSRIDTKALTQISNKIKNKFDDNIEQSEFVSNDFFRINLSDSNGKDGTYGNNYNLHSGMNMNVKIKSSNNKTEMFVYKTKNSKPSLILVTNNDVFDVSENKFTSKKFSASVSDSRGKIGTMLFTVL